MLGSNGIIDPPYDDPIAVSCDCCAVPMRRRVTDPWFRIVNRNVDNCDNVKQRMTTTKQNRLCTMNYGDRVDYTQWKLRLQTCRSVLYHSLHILVPNTWRQPVCLCIRLPLIFARTDLLSFISSTYPICTSACVFVCLYFHLSPINHLFQCLVFYQLSWLPIYLSLSLLPCLLVCCPSSLFVSCCLICKWSWNIYRFLHLFTVCASCSYLV